MSDYDSYHRWEPLAEFHFNLNNHENDELYREKYIYCLCSRVFTREVVKLYEPDRYGSESDAEAVQDVVSSELDDHSHVHFSIDTSHRNKCDKDEVASCYCSASHTDNYCSTDEHEPGQIQASHALQPSDSGADLTYQDYHLDISHEKLEELDEDIIKLDTYEDYLSEDTWDKFWAIHGERLIWASWIKKYSDYINPDYLDENNDILLNENSVPQKVDKTLEENQKSIENVRERKYSYDSKINPVMGSKDDVSGKPVRSSKNDTKDDSWVSVGRRRSSSEHERIVSPKTLAATDSMTNVTKATLSSYNITSSHVTSDSTPTDGYSISSSTSDDQFNDQTRIANVEEHDEVTEELDNDQYWQLLWKKHFGEQYAIHYAYYLECHNHHTQFNDLANKKEKVLDNKLEELKLGNDCENSDGNSQDVSVVEVQKDQIIESTKARTEKCNDNKTGKSKSRKKHDQKVMNSVGALLQLLKEQQEKESEAVDASEEKSTEKVDTVAATPDSTTNENTMQNPQSQNTNSSHIDEEGDNNDPPEERQHLLKRSHELDADELMSERIKSTFDAMGFSLDPSKLPKGELIYKKRIGKLRPPRSKKWNRKTYFDDDGNPLYEKTDDEGNNSIDVDKVDGTIKPEDKHESNEDNESDINQVEREETISQSDIDISERGNKEDISSSVENTSQTKRRRRQKRHRQETDASDLPAELQGEPKMMKYWKKRHSLFHRFDEGIRLDLESWFSVTPENVAAHIADRCANDTILDAFCGAGGNSIQFARTCKRVIAIDIDPKKIELARHNASVYGVDNIDFIVGDFFEVGPTVTADYVFLSPPWGGPKYSEKSEYDIESMLEPKPASELIKTAGSINSNIAIYLPRNSKIDQIVSLAQELGSSVEIEQSYLDRSFVAITAYFY